MYCIHMQYSLLDHLYISVQFHITLLLNEQNKKLKFILIVYDQHILVILCILNRTRVVQF